MSAYAVCVISFEITERKNSEVKLKSAKEKAEENEAKFRGLFDKSIDSIFIFDPDNFKIIEANNATSKIYGYDKSELIGMSCLKFSAEIEQSKTATKKVHQNGEVLVNVRHHKKKDDYKKERRHISSVPSRLTFFMFSTFSFTMNLRFSCSMMSILIMGFNFLMMILGEN